MYLAVVHGPDRAVRMDVRLAGEVRRMDSLVIAQWGAHQCDL
jgi:hypothetical protein